MRVVRPALFALLLATSIASAKEWDGLGAVKLGAAVDKLGEVKSRGQVGSAVTYTRAADADALAKLNLSEIRYVVDGVQVAAIEWTTTGAESTQGFAKALVKSWGQPSVRSEDSKTVAWEGATNKLTMQVAKDGTAVLRLEPMPPKVEQEERVRRGRSSADDMMDWVQEESDKAEEAAARRREAEAQAAAAAASDAEIQARAEELAATEIAKHNAIIERCGAEPDPKNFYMHSQAGVCVNGFSGNAVPRDCCPPGTPWGVPTTNKRP